ncbi:branched-chain amino acid ABC transporter permease [Sphaerisporangium album]|uniref:Branched-chain amino acid ABC transporter permease n=1 Tax=Sphaerisporangium album TaxID=509200 RepID=A0A367FNV4_9ACTN|nr:AzlC family ABC transporter permease [Sphaerisporangium album]RCG32086.1 branched-chain amino acid ABC transporter permease [Sphaerisporangium album]
MLRDAGGIALTSGAYAVSCGAICTAAGLTVPQTLALSLLMFTGASQFAIAGVIGVGGAPFAGAAVAILLGGRNALYGLRLASLLNVRGARKAFAAQFVIDETTAMAVGREPERAGRLGFWATGFAMYALWGLGNLLGALGAQVLPDPEVLGMDVAAPAAFLALLAPRMRSGRPWLVALVAAATALAATPLLPAGVPVLLAAAAVAVLALRLRDTGDAEHPGDGSRPDDSPPEEPAPEESASHHAEPRNSRRPGGGSPSEEEVR